MGIRNPTAFRAKCDSQAKAFCSRSRLCSHALSVIPLNNTSFIPFLPLPIQLPLQNKGCPFIFFCLIHPSKMSFSLCRNQAAPKLISHPKDWSSKETGSQAGRENSRCKPCPYIKHGPKPQKDDPEGSDVLFKSVRSRGLSPPAPRPYIHALLWDRS